MTIKQRISKGLGALTPSAWADIVAVADPANADDPVVRKSAEGGSRTSFTAQITNATQDGTNIKWLYAWTQVRRTNAANTFAAVTGGLTSTTNGGKPGLNVLEAANTATLAYGFSCTSGTGALPISGFTFSRVPNNTIVEMSIRRNASGVTSFEFSAPNPITGACPAAFNSTFDGGSYGGS